MIKGNAIREIRFKSGHVIGKGDPLLIVWPDPMTRPMLADIHHKDKVLSCRASVSLEWIGLKVTEEELGVATMDGTCETPGGITVEPDGVDHAGVPSWLMIHGLI